MSPERKTGFALWFTGLPSSGKTTLALAVDDLLKARGVHVQLLDSDQLRQRLTPKPTYSEDERNWFYEILAYLAGLLTDNGVNVIVAATAPKRRHRQAARSRIARFAEVYLDCPLDVCRSRDPKGLWHRADRGEIATLPGHGVPYEPPDSPEVRVDAATLAASDAASQIVTTLETSGFLLM
jgi:adenylylsulfate kinase